MMWDGGWSGVDWVLMSLVMLVFWTMVVGGVLWIVSVRRPSGTDVPPSQGAADAHAILNERLARGDLSVEEYQARRDLLGSR